MKICSVEGCTNKVHASGFCNTHYRLFKRNGTPERKLVENKGKKCSVEGCEDAAYKKGYCNKHFQRVKKYGSPELPEPKKCSVEGCEGESRSNGFCSKHYQRVRRNNTIDRVDVNPLKGQLCKHCGSGIVVKKDFCHSCYHKHMQKASPNYNLQRRKHKLTRERREKQAESEPYTNQDVWNKSSGLCGICGLRVGLQTDSKNPISFTVDHIIPLAKGGSDTLNNVQAAHRLCNSTKQDLVLAEDKMFNLREKISKLLGE